MNRLNFIKANKHFQSCKTCDFTYLPMTIKTLTDCPKCETIIETDSDYLESELKTEEIVTSENLFDSAPKFTQDEFNNLQGR